MIRKYRRDGKSYKIIDLFKWYIEDEKKFNSFKNEIIEEKFDPDKFLVWLEKPLQKLKGGKIKLYHGTSVKIEDNVIEPRSINVGATKFSDPRWSTYLWDNREDAISWALMWNLWDIIGPYHVAYGYNNKNGKNLIYKPDDVTEKEYKKYILDNIKPFYVYEVEFDIKDLEVGSCPTIREYTVSKPVEITRTFSYTDIRGDICKRFIEFVSKEEFEEYSNKVTNIKTTPNNRNLLMNHILQKGRDLYRGIIRTDLRNGNIKPGDDLSEYKAIINKHYKNDTYNLFSESFIINTMHESSISIPQMSFYLQNQYEEEMKHYLNTYKKYYNLMLEEQPSAVKHINEDIRKALIVIDGLASKGVENNLVQFAKDDLGEIVKASKRGKPVKVYEASGFKIPTNGNLWISTDWHFYKNKNNTGFKINPDIDKILNNYKKCVKDNDTFIFLGDLYDARTIFDMKRVPKIFELKKLKGHKIMIKGNHDVNTTQFYLDLGFDEVYDSIYNIGNIVFSHEPRKVNDDEINIHGHIHFSETYWGMEPLNHLDAFIGHYNNKPVLINDIVNEYRGTGRLSNKALEKFDSFILHESFVEDLVNIDDTLNDINLISVEGDNVSISNNIIECKIVYNTDTRQPFSLRDIDSKLIINDKFIVQRDKFGTHCTIKPLYESIECDNCIEFKITMSDNVEISNNKLTEGIDIINLFKSDDSEFKFIKESCLKLFGVYPEIIRKK
jgi:calcineurin-like phosphoesterase family protein